MEIIKCRIEKGGNSVIDNTENVTYNWAALKVVMIQCRGNLVKYAYVDVYIRVSICVLLSYIYLIVTYGKEALFMLFHCCAYFCPRAGISQDLFGCHPS